jgi:hypothetical protein
VLGVGVEGLGSGDTVSLWRLRVRDVCARALLFHLHTESVMVRWKLGNDSIGIRKYSPHSGLQKYFRAGNARVSVTLSVETPQCPYGLPTVGS